MRDSPYVIFGQQLFFGVAKDYVMCVAHIVIVRNRVLIFYFLLLVGCKFALE